MNDSPEILLIDNQPLILDGLAYLITQSIPNAIVLRAKSLESAVIVLGQRRFDLVITEMLGEFENGTRIVDTIHFVSPGAKILLYSAFDEEVFAPLLLKEGAMGFISKRSKWNETVGAIREVLSGRKYVSAELQSKLLLTNSRRAARFPLQTEKSLSRRELTVMRLLLQGKSTREIASSLNLKGNTVSTFKQRIFRKLNVASPVQLYYFTGLQFHQPVKPSTAHLG